MGGKETWGEGGSQDCVSPVLVYPRGQCDHFCHCNPKQKLFQKIIIKKKIASIPLAKVQTVAFVHTRSLSKNSAQQLLWLRWQLGKYQ